MSFHKKFYPAEYYIKSFMILTLYKLLTKISGDIQPIIWRLGLQYKACSPYSCYSSWACDTTCRRVDKTVWRVPSCSESRWTIRDTVDKRFGQTASHPNTRCRRTLSDNACFYPTTSFSSSSLLWSRSCIRPSCSRPIGCSGRLRLPDIAFDFPWFDAAVLPSHHPFLKTDFHYLTVIFLQY